MMVGTQSSPSGDVTEIPSAIGHLSLGFGHSSSSELTTKPRTIREHVHEWFGSKEGSVAVPLGVAFDGFIPTGEAIDLARKAVDAGAKSLWMAEHLGYPDGILFVDEVHPPHYR